MSGLDRMKQRASYNGYDTHDNFNVTGKYKSFISALRNSYQAEWVTLDEGGESESRWRCLINPDKLKEDYDQKEISIDFESGIKNGDVFYWDRTGTHWLVYLQDHNEEAYFRASIRRCDHEIDVNGRKYWVYLRGPVETAIIWRQKHQIEFNELNYSILIYVQKNEETLDFFSRFQEIEFDKGTWRVAATDKYSQDGIIEVYLEEYFTNPIADMEIPIPTIEPDITKPYIDGPQVVRPYDTDISYSIVGLTSGKFVVNSSKVKIINTTETSCVIEILVGKSGKFTLTYKSNNEEDEDVTLDVTIKSF